MNYPDNNGRVRAGVYVVVTDVLGNTRQRLVSLGTLWNTDIEQAKKVAKNVRDSNPDMNVRVNYSVEL